MKKISGFLLLMICFAFTVKANNGLDAVYGVSKNDPSQIELSLHKDFSFTYQDHSDPLNSIDVHGTYRMKNNTVMLLADGEQMNFHDKWKLKDDGMTASSRKGLTFYTLKRSD